MRYSAVTVLVGVDVRAAGRESCECNEREESGADAGVTERTASVCMPLHTTFSCFQPVNFTELTYLLW